MDASNTVCKLAIFDKYPGNDRGCVAAHEKTC